VNCLLHHRVTAAQRPSLFLEISLWLCSSVVVEHTRVHKGKLALALAGELFAA
jgi:hypothetical protein